MSGIPIFNDAGEKEPPMLTKEFPTEAVLSLTTDRLLCDFGVMHELAEWVLGHPVWTHEFADKGLWERMKAKLFEQHPSLADFDVSRLTEWNWSIYVEKARKQFGPRLAVTQGDAGRTESPVDSAVRLMGGSGDAG